MANLKTLSSLWDVETRKLENAGYRQIALDSSWPRWTSGQARIHPIVNLNHFMVNVVRMHCTVKFTTSNLTSDTGVHSGNRQIPPDTAGRWPMLDHQSNLNSPHGEIGIQFEYTAW